MASQDELDFTYTFIDEIFRLSLGETGDFSGARYNGNFDQSLEEAQHAKHEFIAGELNITSGSRVIDLGCGWGPFIRYLKETKNANCLGLTLSEGQWQACRNKGYEVVLKDCRNVGPADLGYFDAAVSLGAFEHFCSYQDFKEGQQEKIYAGFMEAVASLLPVGGRFYLQTMTFGKNMIPDCNINIHANQKSNEYILALMMKQFPGSWLPYGSEMVLKAADPFFKLVNISSGRLDYIETIRQWRKRFRKFHPRKYWLYLRLLLHYFRDPEFQHRLAIFQVSPNKVCFERELMDHYRIVFEKR